MLTKNERERYDRQIMIKGFGVGGQEKLKKARIFIAGAGGLGSPSAIYLTAAGVGMIRIADYDRVGVSNLNRQILHWNVDIGKQKVISASEKLKILNPDIEIEALSQRITEENIADLVADSDLIVDATDNLPIRYLLNKISLEKKIPLFHGAIHGFEGRVTTIIPDKTACLRCSYRGVPPGEKFPVVGVTPAIIACIQSTEVIKYIVGIGDLLLNRLLIYDGLTMKFTEFKIKRDPKCEHCGH
jgi:molybdopterin/thiamine biosynthesis adenylyltransferase